MSEPKPLNWVGSSLKDVRGFPEDVRSEAGYGLYLAQLGRKHLTARPLKTPKHEIDLVRKRLKWALQENDGE